MHRATARDQKYIGDPMIGDKLQDIVGQLHSFLGGSGVDRPSSWFEGPEK
jgi:hypothetical protein